MSDFFFFEIRIKYSGRGGGLSKKWHLAEKQNCKMAGIPNQGSTAGVGWRAPPCGLASPLINPPAVSVCAQPSQASVNYYVPSEEVVWSAVHLVSHPSFWLARVCVCNSAPTAWGLQEELESVRLVKAYCEGVGLNHWLHLYSCGEVFHAGRDFLGMQLLWGGGVTHAPVK